MATISTAIALRDGMSGPLKSIIQENRILLTTLTMTQRASRSMMDITSLSESRAEITDVGKRIQAADSSQQKFNLDIKKGKEDVGLFGDKLHKTAQAAMLLSIKSGVGFVKSAVEAANQQMESERKLETAMRQRMGATNQAVQSTKSLISTQQRIGVVGAQAQAAGAQQLSTYLDTSTALNTLIPAMNDLAVQQNGVSNTAGTMGDTSTLLGKAMQGQLNVLSQAGITYTAAQEKVMRYGNEQQKAVVLAQVISNNVGQMNQAVAATPQGKIAQMVNEWESMRSMIGEQLYPAILRLFDSIISHSPQIQVVMLGLAAGISYIVQGLSLAIGIAASFGSFIVKNWSMIGPIVMGIATAIAVYTGFMLIHNAVQAVGNILKTISIISAVAHGKAIDTDMLATTNMTKAQLKFNATLFACPLTWILLGIIAVIAIIYLAVAAINKVTGSTISAAGLIIGVLLTLGAFVLNLLIGLLNSCIQLIWNIFVNPFLGIAEWILNVVNGGFNGLGGAIANLIGQIISWFLSLGKVVTTIIDAIFGTQWTKGLTSLQNSVLKWGKTDNAITLSREAPTIDRIAYGDAWKTGNKLGTGLENKLKSGFSMPKLPNPDSNPKPPVVPGLDGAQFGKDMSATAGNTGKMAKSMGSSEDDLKYLRDIAERDTINRFTTAQLSVSMNTTAHIKNDMDIDGVISKLTDKTYEALLATAEGV